MAEAKQQIVEESKFKKEKKKAPPIEKIGLWNKTTIDKIHQTPITNYNIGADPEIFIQNTTTGQIVDSASFLEVTHSQSNDTKCQLVADGVQAEFHMMPCTCRESLISNMRASFIDGINKMRKANKAYDYLLTCAVDITPADLARFVPASNIFGCAPSRNAYQETLDIPAADSHPYRYAGGHMHFDLSQCMHDIKDLDMLTKLMDYFVGLPSVTLSKYYGNINNERLRRRYYGRAGDYRFNEKTLVYEYRTPSNFWLAHPALMSILFAAGRQALRIAISGKGEEFLKPLDMESIRNTINICDIHGAIRAIYLTEPIRHQLETINVYDKYSTKWNLRGTYYYYPLFNELLPIYDSYTDSLLLKWDIHYNNKSEPFTNTSYYCNGVWSYLKKFRPQSLFLLVPYGCYEAILWADQLFRDIKNQKKQKISIHIETWNGDEKIYVSGSDVK